MHSADYERLGVQRCGRRPVAGSRRQLAWAGRTVFNGVMATPMQTPPPPPATLETIAGSATLDEVLECLRARRPVFHSEADLQHSFALAVGEVAPDVRCRLEIPVRGSNASEYLDLLCLGPASRTAIEFKYVTRQWSGTAGTPPEEYALRGHNAPDVAHRDFLRDVARLEHASATARIRTGWPCSSQTRRPCGAPGNAGCPPGTRSSASTTGAN